MRMYMSFFTMTSVLLRIMLYSYEVLSDPDMRRVYDARGEAGLNEQGGMGGMDPQVRSRMTTLMCLN